MLAKSSGKSDGPIIDVLRVVQSSRDVSYSIKAPRRWIPVDEREPDKSDWYEVVSVEGVDYTNYTNSHGFDLEGVTHWRKQPKFPKG